MPVHRPVATSVLLFVLAVVAGADLLAVHHPDAVDLAAARQPPCGTHWLGTDEHGRDVFARLLHGGRVSLAAGFASAAIAVGLGAVLGAVAGVARGWVDVVIMRVADVFLSFPVLVVVIVLAGVAGPGLALTVVVIGVFTWPAVARVVRAVALSVREEEYVLAARAMGARTSWVVQRHVLPVVLPQVVVVGVLAVSTGVLAEATLSFLGVGVQPPAASWGSMLTDARSLTVLSAMPWLWVPPAVAIALTVMSAGFLGDGRRER